MEPTIKTGDRLTIDTSAYEHTAPARWDIVLFKFPDSRDNTTAVMRIVGLPGETVDIRDDSIILEGKPISSPPRLPHIRYGSSKSRVESDNVKFPLLIPEKGYFLLGDNSLHARDSRFWGVLPAAAVVGKVILR